MSKEIKELHDAILRVTQSVILHTPRYSKFGGYEGENDIYTMDIAKVLYHEEKYRKRCIGRWFKDDFTKILKCNMCGNDAPIHTTSGEQYEAKYCQSCGAKMKGCDGDD